MTSNLVNSSQGLLIAQEMEKELYAFDNLSNTTATLSTAALNLVSALSHLTSTVHLLILVAATAVVAPRF